MKDYKINELLEIIKLQEQKIFELETENEEKRQELEYYYGLERLYNKVFKDYDKVIVELEEENKKLYQQVNSYNPKEAKDNVNSIPKKTQKRN